MLTIYIDMDDVLCDYSSTIKEHRQKNPDNPFPQSVPGFFRSLKPMDGSLASSRGKEEYPNCAMILIHLLEVIKPITEYR